MKAQEQDVNNQQMSGKEILSKFNIDVITKLEERKAPTDAWTVESLKKSIRHYVIIHETDCSTTFD